MRRLTPVEKHQFEIKRFIINLSLFICIILAIAYPLQRIIDSGLKKSNFSDEYKEWYDITKSKINADIIIQGSSKARLQFSPQEFEKSFNLSTYNLGMDGQSFPMQKWRFDVYIKYNKKPKYIIQVVAPRDLMNPDITFNYTQFIPYLEEGFIERFDGHGFLNSLDFYVPLFKYCHNTGIMEAGLKNFLKKEHVGNKKYKGFATINTEWTNKELNALKKQHPQGMKFYVSPVAYSNYIDLIKFCKKESINLIFVCPPTPLIFQNLIVNYGEVMQTYKDMADKYGLKYLDYSRDSLCRDTTMFYNFNHLNTAGVAIFDKQLIYDLKDEIK